MVSYYNPSYPISASNMRNANCPHTMIDAGRWRTWQESNFTKGQADRINKLLKEIEEENAKSAQAESERKKRDEETGFGS